MALTLDDYEVTEHGKIINKTTGYILKPKHNATGYCYVRLGGKNYLIHRLVAQKYIPNPDNKPQINHKDGNKDNNDITNLEWVTAKENKVHAVEHNLVANGEKIGTGKLTKEDVQFIRAHAKKDIKIKDLATMFNVSVRAISNIVNYHTWNSIEE